MCERCCASSLLSCPNSETGINTGGERRWRRGPAHRGFNVGFEQKLEIPTSETGEITVKRVVQEEAHTRVVQGRHIPGLVRGIYPGW